MLEHDLHHNLIITDVLVTHPNRSDPAIRVKPLVAAESGWKGKTSKYSRAYNFQSSVVEPLVFEVYGGYADRTHAFLRETVRSMAAGDGALEQRLWGTLRNRIAVALANGQAEVIQYFNYRNGQNRRHYQPSPWLASHSQAQSNGYWDRCCCCWGRSFHNWPASSWGSSCCSSCSVLTVGITQGERGTILLVRVLPPSFPNLFERAIVVVCRVWLEAW